MTNNFQALPVGILDNLKQENIHVFFFPAKGRTANDFSFTGRTHPATVQLHVVAQTT